MIVPQQRRIQKQYGDEFKLEMVVLFRTAGITAVHPPFHIQVVRIFATICLLCGSLPVVAGDYYLRFGVSQDLANDTVFSDRNCLNLYPSALYGCGTGGDGHPYRSNGDFKSALGLELGVGISATPRFRVELVAEKRRQSEFVGLANFLPLGDQQDVVASIESTLGLMVAHVDLTDGMSSRFGGITPFVGFGFGIVRNECSDMRMEFPRTITTVPGDAQMNLAAVVALGLSFDLNQERTKFDLTWRFMDLGEIRTARDVGQVAWKSGSREPLLLNLDLTRGRSKSRGLKLSIRHTL